MIGSCVRVGVCVLCACTFRAEMKNDYITTSWTSSPHQIQLSL